MANEDFQNQIDNLKKEINNLKVKRIYQEDITPQSIKNRAQGEPNTYVYSGLEANLPTTGVSLKTTGLGCSIYWCTDSFKLKIWTGSVWKSVTLT